MPPDTVVAIMVRSPAAAGAIKTRLAHGIPAVADRLTLYTALASDVVRAARAVDGVDLRVAIAGPPAPAWLDSIGVAPRESFPQRGGDLGARELAVFEDLFAQSVRRVVLVGSDLPGLPAGAIADTLARLAEAPDAVVLGPSDDGGYYLMGMAAPAAASPVPDLFSTIRWSTASAWDDTLAAASRAGVRVISTARWFDVDDEIGWAKLTALVAEGKLDAIAPATCACVRALTSR